MAFHATADYPIMPFPEYPVAAETFTPEMWKAQEGTRARHLLGKVAAKAKKAGVAQVSMAPDKRSVTVTYDAFRVSAHQFETAVRVMGCEIERLFIRAMETPEPANLPGAGHRGSAAETDGLGAWFPQI